MDPLRPKAPRPDTSGWPVVDAIPPDIYLGEFVHDCWPNLTDEQKRWPVIEAIPSGEWLGSYDQDGNRLDVPPGQTETSGADSMHTFTVETDDPPAAGG